MTEPRFLQIHTLTPYVAALLNRDDTGLAKRLPYGGATRTRISSQCLKRHWRLADDPHALHAVEGAEESVRSRSLVSDAQRSVMATLRAEGHDPEVLNALQTWFNFVVYGGKDDKKPSKRGQQVATDIKKSRQTLLFGAPELNWLTSEARRLAVEAAGNADRAFQLGQQWAEGGDKKDKEAAANFKSNIKAMRAGAALPGGLTAALFGRMVTSDPEANIAAPVHVAHAFTVHAEESESDYFTAVDDLSEDEPGADTIQETELTSGLFYGYVVVDLRGLRHNLGGDARLAGDVLHNLVHLIAEVSPGAKLGSTAPYVRAALMLLEAGDRQPRSLAEAFRDHCAPIVAEAEARLWKHLQRLDEIYATGEERRVLSLSNGDLPAPRLSLADLGAWARSLA